MNQPDEIMTASSQEPPLTDQELREIDAYWRDSAKKLRLCEGMAEGADY